jgi:hypothetical protein
MATRKSAARQNRKKAARVAKPRKETSARQAAAVAKPRKTAARRAAAPRARGLAAVRGADRREVAGVQLEIGRAGAARVKRLVYPAGFRWSTHMKPMVGTELCMHAHVGFLAQGQIHIQYADGCVVEFMAPQIVAIEPGHDGWVVGRAPAVMIEFDFERDTARRFGMPEAHRHA